MQELPEGPLTDKNGKKWNIELSHKNVYTNRDNQTEYSESFYKIIPHVERHPLFIDLAGNPVHEGDKTYFALSDGSICEGKCYAHTKGLPGTFLHRSDCEKWVASNVKRNTDKEMWEFSKQVIYNYGSQFKTKEELFAFINDLIKEKCL